MDHVSRSTWFLMAALLLWATVGERVVVGQQDRSLVSVPVRAASVDLSVVDAGGHPVVDLTPEEVTVALDGRQVKLRSLRYVFRGAGAVESALAAPSAIPAAAVAARVILIAVDEQDRVKL